MAVCSETWFSQAGELESRLVGEASAACEVPDLAEVSLMISLIMRVQRTFNVLNLLEVPDVVIIPTYVTTHKGQKRPTRTLGLPDIFFV